MLCHFFALRVANLIQQLNFSIMFGAGHFTYIVDDLELSVPLSDAPSSPDQEWPYFSHTEHACDSDVVVAPHELLIIMSCLLLTPNQVRLVQQHHHANKLLFSRVARGVNPGMRKTLCLCAFKLHAPKL